MRKSLLAFVLMFAVFSTPAFCQDSGDLTWLPDGVYFGLFQFNSDGPDENLDSGWHQQLLKNVYRFMEIDDGTNGLADFNRMTMAMVSEINWVEEREPDAGEQEHFLDFFDLFFIYHFDDPQQMVDKLLADGSLVPQGQKMLGREIYQIKSKQDPVADYLYLFDDGSVIVAESTLTLQAMLAARTGYAESILDNRDFAEIEQLIPDKAIWFISFEGHAMRAGIEEDIDEGVEEAESQFEELQARPEFELIYIEISDKLMIVTRRIYEKEKYAVASFERKQPSLSFDLFPEEALITQSNRIEGRQIISRQEFDPEIVLQKNSEKD
jgi:hypothetical protein